MAQWQKRRIKKRWTAKGAVKRHVFGPRSMAYVVIAKTRSNHLFTLTDLYGKIVQVFYSGRADITGPRRKRSVMAAEQLGVVLGEYAVGLSVKTLLIILKVPVSAHIYAVVRGLTSCGLHLWGFKDSCSVSHNGMRRKKERRV